MKNRLEVAKELLTKDGYDIEIGKDFETIGKEPNGLEKQKRLLAELLYKNQLYVNLPEIDNAQFKVSMEDKTLNRAFYGDGQ